MADNLTLNKENMINLIAYIKMLKEDKKDKSLFIVHVLNQSVRSNQIQKKLSFLIQKHP